MENTTAGATTPRVEVDMNRETGEGSMFVADDATPAEIRAAHAEIDAAGWEALDSFETGDDYDTDDHGRSVVPLVRNPGN
ncbi:hypothetical protein ACFFX1_08165 [Dactylosporangium sucinum]|uniref:Uncharacterized protein n=1 Tax=Dactylosporangium sucinum TaxID=1424081 RepID=A0A917X0W2_9ACTN|nr:hypothetical protein [Dactylosporangium sucinum]GGM55557.1 hypothetical protein GCM10007977_066560 [Dactylosporangium sucinum]